MFGYRIFTFSRDVNLGADSFIFFKFTDVISSSSANYQPIFQSIFKLSKIDVVALWVEHFPITIWKMVFKISFIGFSIIPDNFRITIGTIT